MAKRLAGMCAVLAVVSILVFSLLQLAPGSVIQTLLGDRPSTSQQVAALTAQYHLNDSFIGQYWHWLVGALHFSFGRSIQSGQLVSSLITEHLVVSAELALYAFVIVLLVGLPAGILSGIRRGWIDRGISSITIVGMSAPPLVVGLVLIYILGIAIPIFPVYGIGSGLGQRLDHLTLPALALAIPLTAYVSRQARASALEIMEQDYIMFARARGLSRWDLYVRYALRNISLPILTSAGLTLIYALSGAVVVENVFSIPGVGSLMVQSVTARDMPIVQGLSLTLAVLVVVINLLVDLLVLAVDPRSRRLVGARS